MNKILNALPLIFTAFAVGTTSFFTVKNVIPELNSSSNNKVIEVNQSSDPIIESQLIETTPTTTPTPARISTNSNEYTLSQLASHNSSKSCYVAYRGRIYDVTGNRSWTNCSHHGIRGGQDITSRFPHPVSYLSGIPIVGTLVNKDRKQIVSTPPKPVNTEHDEDDDREDHNDEDHNNDSDEHEEDDD